MKTWFTVFPSIYGRCEDLATHLMPCGKVCGGKSSPRLPARVAIQSPANIASDILIFGTRIWCLGMPPCKETHPSALVQGAAFCLVRQEKTRYQHKSSNGYSSLLRFSEAFCTCFSVMKHGQQGYKLAFLIKNGFHKTYQRVLWLNQDKTFMVHMPENLLKSSSLSKATPLLLSRSVSDSDLDYYRLSLFSNFTFRSFACLGIHGFTIASHCPVM
jgi:hypothetical protein